MRKLRRTVKWPTNSWPFAPTHFLLQYGVRKFEEHLIVGMELVGILGWEMQSDWWRKQPVQNSGEKGYSEVGGRILGEKVLIISYHACYITGPLEYPRFHNAQRNRFGRIVEPSSRFRLVITTSKNNAWIVAQGIRSRSGEEGNLWEETRTLFKTHAGCIGKRKSDQKRPSTAAMIGESFGKKCKHFGIAWADVVFRRSMRVPDVLRGLKFHVGIKSLVHIPRLPKCKPPKPKKRRRV